MRSQWWWLNQLIIAFQQHVRNAEMYQQVPLLLTAFNVLTLSNVAMLVFAILFGGTPIKRGE